MASCATPTSSAGHAQAGARPGPKLTFHPDHLPGADHSETHLNGRAVDQIFPDLTAGNANLTLAARLSENAGVCFEGCKKYGPFDVPGDVARQWLALPINPNGRSNSE